MNLLCEQPGESKEHVLDKPPDNKKQEIFSEVYVS